MNLQQTLRIRLLETCHWVKAQRHFMFIAGGVFFLLALIAGVIWMFGYEIEPLAFVLGMLSSMLFASPSVAEYFLPDRKSLQDMSFDEIKAFILTTDPKNDWRRVTRGIEEEWFLLEDPRLRIGSTHSDEDVANDDFKEPWANSHADPNATSYWYKLTYDGAFLERLVMVSVDGARSTMPLPDQKTQRISRYSYHIAKITDYLGYLDEYIRRSGLTVEDS